MPRKSAHPQFKRLSTYAVRIRELREDHDLTQAQIAELLNVSQRTYADYEYDNIHIPVDALMRLACYYNVGMDDLCGIKQINGRYIMPSEPE